MSSDRALKRRRVLPPETEAALRTQAVDQNLKFYKSAAKWNLEQPYESRPRINSKKGSSKLPIKTAEGWVAQVEPSPEQSEDEADSLLDEATTSSAHDHDPIRESEAKRKQIPAIPAKQQILQAKEELARLASHINEDPEEHAGSLRRLAEIGSSDNITVVKLVLATQLAVFKDIIPGYRIRPLEEELRTEKLSKEVKKLKTYEQSLVSAYQEFLKVLSKNVRDSTGGLSSVATSCACNLLLTVPHFNFRSQLLEILVSKVSQRTVDQDFQRCTETFEKLFVDDEDGNASLEAVALLTKMMKGRHYEMDESVLNTFLHLRLLSEFSARGSHVGIDKIPLDSSSNIKESKKKREFRTKKERKRMKEHKAIEKEMKEADASVSHEERDRMQAETLKLVFIAYFRILKARKPRLMGAVLEGLARFSKHINQDFFADIVEALRELVTVAQASAEQGDGDGSLGTEDSSDLQRNVTRESLLCIITAFSLLHGQDEAKAASALHLDLSFFNSYLYTKVLPTALNADVELGPKSLRLPDPHASQTTRASNPTKVNVQTTTVLLIRSLSSVLLPPTGIRAVPPKLIGAFARQILIAAPHMPEKSSLALLGLMQKVAKVHGKKIAALWNTEERKGDGVFDPLRTDLNGVDAFASTAWETQLLRLHYSPAVRESAKLLEKIIREVDS